MPDAVIVAAARTPIGTARKGTLLDVTAFDLAKYAAGEALKRSGIPAGDVDDMQMGESLQGGGDIARYAAIELGLIEVPGVALNRHCASGMAAVQGAAGSIIAGMDKVVIAGGVGEHVDIADGHEAHARAPTTGRSGCRRRTPSSPTRPRSTCRSRSAGTPRRPPASPARTATRGRCVRTSGRSRRSTKAASKRRSSRSR